MVVSRAPRTKPSVPVGTRNMPNEAGPEGSWSVRATTNARPAARAFVTHFLVPDRIQPRPSRRALALTALASLPAPGSESAKQAVVAPLASSGSQRERCASLPYSWTRRTPNALWMDSINPTAGSPQDSSSRTAR